MNLKFVFAYTPDEFSEAFRMILKDPDRLKLMITGETGLSGVNAAFDALAAGEDIKLLVRPDLP
ncbi:MAG: hypothetical protein R3E21_01735 [Caenibius sp.]